MTRVAAVDCGTNSIRLLVADLDDAEGAPLREVDRRMEIVRLGEGVDRTGRLSPAALERTFTACDAYAEVIRATGAERVRFVATSASRDVENRDVFVAGVRERLGVDPEVVTGDEEARLSFAGATRELLGGAAATPFLVVDIGGGSTELVLGARDVTAACSVDVGCVRMTERHLHDDPPTAEQVAAVRADVEEAVRDAARTVPLAEASTLVGLAGSVTTVAAMALGLAAYDPARIHHSRISAADVHDVARTLLAMTRDERAALHFMHPGRVDVIGAGALVLAVVLENVPVDEVLVSEHDILDG
ncbi:MAG TPA: Ppx/GppA phosphatase family protein, partial [Actinomycetes bacterium]|nr:Ppx/GppA phosphatase family protein [Actinomycetes bacterium]